MIGNLSFSATQVGKTIFVVAPSPSPSGPFGLHRQGRLDQGATQARQSRLARLLTWAGAAIVGIAYYVWDDLLFASPVIWLTSQRGGLSAWLTAAPAYTAASFGLTLFALRVHRRMSSGSPTRVAGWIDKLDNARRGGRVRALIRGGSVLAFVVASFLIGSIATMWIIAHSGRTDHLVQLSAASAVIFGLTFTAQYAGASSFFF